MMTYLLFDAMQNKNFDLIKPEQCEVTSTAQSSLNKNEAKGPFSGNLVCTNR